MFRSSKTENISHEAAAAAAAASESSPNIPKLQMELLHDEEKNEQKKEKNNANENYRVTEDSVSTFIQELLLIMISSNSAKRNPENQLTLPNNYANFDNYFRPNSDRSYERPKKLLIADLSLDTNQSLS
uniref:Uncharacterized protein n=1 Tax=Panagrolaimus superbus TaxID=310955 RepID=A0A914YAY7_9BILA